MKSAFTSECGVGAAETGDRSREDGPENARDRAASVAETSRIHPAREGAAWSSGIIGVVPRLKCGQGECVGEATGNAVKSVQNDRGRRRSWTSSQSSRRVLPDIPLEVGRGK